MTRIDRGTVIPVRTTNTIDSDRADDQVYFGRVADDVRGEDGRLAIPAGSHVELMVRVEPDRLVGIAIRTAPESAKAWQGLLTGARALRHRAVHYGRTGTAKEPGPGSGTGLGMSSAL